MSAAPVIHRSSTAPIDSGGMSRRALIAGAASVLPAAALAAGSTMEETMNQYVSPAEMFVSSERIEQTDTELLELERRLKAAHRRWHSALKRHSAAEGHCFDNYPSKPVAEKMPHDIEAALGAVTLANWAKIYASGSEHPVAVWNRESDARHKTAVAAWEAESDRLQEEVGLEAIEEEVSATGDEWDKIARAMLRIRARSVAGMLAKLRTLRSMKRTC